MDGEDKKFGFFDVGVLVTLPLTALRRSVGSWSVHGGLDVVVMGERTKRANDDESTKLTGLIGIGLSYEAGVRLVVSTRRLRRPSDGSPARTGDGRDRRLSSL